jgi:hypothetical protein
MIEVKRKIHVPIFGGWIPIVITDEDNTYESAKRNFKMDDKSLKMVDGVVLGRAENSDRVYPVLFSRNVTPGLIAHEAKHLVNKIYADLDISLDKYNDEAEAYLLSWIVNRIWEVKTKYEKLLNS